MKFPSLVVVFAFEVVVPFSRILELVVKYGKEVVLNPVIKLVKLVNVAVTAE